jgi:mRNA-degrading endonuclease RelE of RelBE toxin-antitoxin system
VSWHVVVRPAVEADLVEASAWYEHPKVALDLEFVAEVLRVLDQLELNPFLNSRRSRKRHVRWCLTKRFPYRVVYRIDETSQIVVVLSALHTARDDHHWRERFDS